MSNDEIRNPYEFGDVLMAVVALLIPLIAMRLFF